MGFFWRIWTIQKIPSGIHGWLENPGTQWRFLQPVARKITDFYGPFSTAMFDYRRVPIISLYVCTWPLKRYLKVYPGDDWVRIWWLGVIRVVLLKLLGMSINPLRYLYMICIYNIPLIWLVYANPSVLHFHLSLFKGETGLQKCFFLHYLPRCLVRIIQMYRSISLRSIYSIYIYIPRFIIWMIGWLRIQMVIKSMGIYW